jgi:hypothetical protein
MKSRKSWRNTIVGPEKNWKNFSVSNLHLQEAGGGHKGLLWEKKGYNENEKEIRF